MDEQDLYALAVSGRISRRDLIKRAVILGLSGSAITALLAACSSAGATAAPSIAATSSATSSASPGASSGQEKVTLAYWTHVNPPSQTVETDLITAYENLNPNVTVNYLPVQWNDLPTKLTTSIAGGAGPDIVNYFQPFATALVAKNFVVPVDFGATGVDEPTFTGNYVPSVLEGFTYGGTIYAIPHEVSNHAFWINTSMFQKAGLDPVADFPKTWTDVVRVGQKIQTTGAAKEGIALTLYNQNRSMQVLGMMARQAGGKLLSDDGKTALLDSPEVIRALTQWADFVLRDKINDPALGPTASTLAEDVFGNGTASMTGLGASYFVGNLKQLYPKVFANYAVGQQPTFEGGVDIGSEIQGFGLWVTATSKQQQEAWKFARFLTDANAAESYYQGAGVWLGDKASAASPLITQSPHWDVFEKSVSRGYFSPQLVSFTEMTQIVDRAVQRVVLSGVSAETSLAQAQQEASALLG